MISRRLTPEIVSFLIVGGAGYVVDVGAFSIETQNVTNARYQEFVNADASA